MTKRLTQICKLRAANSWVEEAILFIAFRLTCLVENKKLSETTWFNQTAVAEVELAFKLITCILTNSIANLTFHTTLIAKMTKSTAGTVTWSALNVADLIVKIRWIQGLGTFSWSCSQRIVGTETIEQLNTTILIYTSLIANKITQALLTLLRTTIPPIKPTFMFYQHPGWQLQAWFWQSTELQSQVHSTLILLMSQNPAEHLQCWLSHLQSKWLHSRLHSESSKSIFVVQSGWFARQEENWS